MSAAIEEQEDQRTLIKVRGLTVTYPTPVGDRPAVANCDLEIRRGEILGVVGESGSGKSTLALALLNAVSAPGKITTGAIEVAGAGDITAWSGERLRRYRGARVGYVFQASQNSLNPLKRVGKQLLDLGRSHGVKDLRGLITEARRAAATGSGWTAGGCSTPISTSCPAGCGSASGSSSRWCSTPRC